MIKFLKAKNNLESSKRVAAHQIELSVDFSLETLEDRKQWQIPSKYSKQANLTQGSFSGKNIFKIEAEIKTYLIKTKRIHCH